MASKKQELFNNFRIRRENLRDDIKNEIINIFHDEGTNVIETDDLEVLFYTNLEAITEIVTSIELQDERLLFHTKDGDTYQLGDVYYGEEFWIFGALV